MPRGLVAALAPPLADVHVALDRILHGCGAHVAAPTHVAGSGGAAHATAFDAPDRGHGSEGAAASAEPAAPGPEAKLKQWPVDPSAWRTAHNYHLDRGSKFMIAFRSPFLMKTDLFDLQKFGCYEERGWAGFKLLDKANANYGKFWWKHPEISFGGPLGTIGVTLQDESTGEIKWDAVYNLKGKQHLLNEDKPIGGSHPFFQPDWCPAPPGATAHRLHLVVSNLDSLPRAGLERAGEMIFMQYGPTSLENTYKFEDTAPTSFL